MTQRLMPIDEVYIFQRRYIHLIDEELYGGVNDKAKPHSNRWVFFILIMVTLTWVIPFILLEPIMVGILNWKGEVVNATISAMQEGRQNPIDFFTFGTISYHYTPEGAEEPLYWTQPVVENTFVQLHVGDPVLITYSPDFPDFARLAGANADAATIINTFIILLGTLMIYLIVWRIIMHPDKVRGRLEKNGKVVLGELIAYYSDQTSASGFNPFRGGPRATIQFRFKNPDDEEIIKTQEGILNNAQNNRLEPTPGIKIMILYADPSFYRVL